MKVLLVNTSESIGGAAVAASRLMHALRRQGIDAAMLVRDKQSDDPYVMALPCRYIQKLRFLIDRIWVYTINGFSRKGLFDVDLAKCGCDITKLKAFQEADVIHLHWINQGMLSLRDLDEIFKSGKKVVWTMHDMWTFTSICHIPYECSNYNEQCCNCPKLRFQYDNDISSLIYNSKKNIYRNANVALVAVSNWLKKQASGSALINNNRIEVIPNTLPVEQFRRLDMLESRTRLELPKTKYIVMFSAAKIDDPVKGFPLLLNAIELLIRNKYFKREELMLLLVGSVKNRESLDSIPVEYKELGYIQSFDDLSAAYSSANVLVSSSYYETFGQTLIEAQACGCIPVSFGNGGQSDIIEHKQNGYIADYLSPESLAEGIFWGITQSSKIDKKEMRQIVMDKYSEEVVANKYIKLYQE